MSDFPLRRLKPLARLIAETAACERASAIGMENLNFTATGSPVDVMNTQEHRLPILNPLVQVIG